MFFNCPPASVALNSFCEVAEGIKKCADEHYGNTAIVPVLDTLHVVPWSGDGKYKVGSVLCETKWMDGSAQEACLRLVLVAKLGYQSMSTYYSNAGNKGAPVYHVRNPTPMQLGHLVMLLDFLHYFLILQDFYWISCFFAGFFTPSQKQILLYQEIP